MAACQKSLQNKSMTHKLQCLICKWCIFNRKRYYMRLTFCSQSIFSSFSRLLWRLLRRISGKFLILILKWPIYLNTHLSTPVLQLKFQNVKNKISKMAAILEFTIRYFSKSNQTIPWVSQTSCKKFRLIHWMVCAEPR